MIIPIIIILVFILFLIFVGYEVKEMIDNDDFDAENRTIGFIILVIILALMILPYITYMKIDATVAEYNARAEILEAQYQYLIPLDEEKIAYIGIEDVYKDTFYKIRQHNESVVYKQAMVNNIWLGWFYPKQWNNARIVQLNYPTQ